MTNRNDQVISILNFNPKSRREPILNSPRSIEACRRQGIEPRELVVKYFADFKEQYRFKKISNEALVIMTEHHEERRKDKVQIVIEEREQVIEDIEDGYVIGPVSPAKGTKPKITSPRIAKSSIQSLLSTATDSTTIELEKRRFDQINRKNAKQIRHLVEHGDQVSEIKEENELRKAEEREKARLEELQKEQARKEAAERKRLAELEKHRRLQEEEEIRKQMALEAKKKDDLKMALEQEEQRKKQAEAKMKEEENKRKHEVFLKNLESKAQERQEEIYERQKEIEQQEKLSKEQLEEQQLEKKRANEHKKRVTKAKIMLTQEKNSEIMAKRKMDYDSKLEQEEEKRRQFELERQQKLEENKRAAIVHAQNIQKVIEENEKMQDEKKEKYNAKLSKFEEKQKEFDAQRELEMQKKAEEERKREEARQRVKEHMETMVKEKVNKYLEMREESQEKFVKVRREKEEELKKKHRAELIEYTEKMENIQRAAKKDEYKRQKLREKIQEEDERVEKIKNDKSTLLEMRKMIKRDLDLNKESLNEKFELMRSGKLKNNLSVDGAYPRTIRSPQDMSVLQSTSTINSPSPVARSMKGGASKVEAQDMSVVQSTSTINSPSTVARSLKTGASKVFEALSRIIAPKKPEKPAQPYLSEVKTMPDEERNRGLDELKAKHNQAMLRLLEDERQKEKQREAKLKSILYSEDKKRKV